MHSSIVRALVVASMCIGCLSCDGVSTSSPTDSMPLAVEVITIAETAQRVEERVPGQVVPKLEATLEAKVQGRISSLGVSSGDSVRQGALIVTIDAKEIAARRDQAQVALRQATMDLDRYAKLKKAGAATHQEFENAETKVKILEANLSEAETLLGYVLIRAPFDGVVTAKYVDTGDLATIGKPLVKIESQEVYRFVADIPETLAMLVHEKSTLRVQLAGEEGIREGQVDEISPTMNSASRTLQVKVTLPKTAPVKSGQFGYLIISTTPRDTITIPAQALVVRGQLEGVYVLEGDRANYRIVRTGRERADGIEIVAGLSPGERIVNTYVPQLRDQMRVEVRHE